MVMPSSPVQGRTVLAPGAPENAANNGKTFIAVRKDGVIMLADSHSHLAVVLLLHCLHLLDA